MLYGPYNMVYMIYWEIELEIMVMSSLKLALLQLFEITIQNLRG